MHLFHTRDFYRARPWLYVFLFTVEYIWIFQYFFTHELGEVWNADPAFRPFFDFMLTFDVHHYIALLSYFQYLIVLYAFIGVIISLYFASIFLPASPNNSKGKKRYFRWGLQILVPLLCGTLNSVVLDIVSIIV